MCSATHNLSAMAATLLLAAGLLACTAASSREEARGPTARIERGDFVRELLLTGELEAVNSVAIKAPETSVFQMRIQFMAEEGSVVELGDPLVDFDNSVIATRVLDLESRILDAETRLVAQRSQLASSLKDLEIELAEREHAHARATVEAAVEAGILPRKVHAARQLALSTAAERLEETRARMASTRARGQADLDVLLIERDKLRKDLQSVQRDVDLLSIKAPAAGLVVYESRQRTTARYQEGDSCWPGQTVMRLPDLSEMQVSFHVNEVDARLLRVGLPVSIRVDSFPGRVLDGRIVHLPSMAVQKSDSSTIAVFEVSCSLSETWIGEMKPGMSVQGRAVVERREDVPMVPRRAVRSDGERHWLRLPAGDGGAREIEIEPVDRNATHYVLAEEELPRLTRLARDGEAT